MTTIGHIFVYLALFTSIAWCQTPCPGAPTTTASSGPCVTTPTPVPTTSTASATSAATTVTAPCPGVATTTAASGPCPSSGTTAVSPLSGCTGCALSLINTNSPDGTSTSLTIVTAPNPNGCEQAVLICPAATRFTVIYANGATVDNNYSGPVFLNCSSAAAPTGVFPLGGADPPEIARLKLFGFKFQSANIFIGAVTGLQVIACFCHQPVVTTSAATTAAAATTGTPAPPVCMSGTACNPSNLVDDSSSDPSEFYSMQNGAGCVISFFVCNIGDTLTIDFASFPDAIFTYNGSNAVQVFCSSGNFFTVAASSTAAANSQVDAILCTPPSGITTTVAATTAAATTAPLTIPPCSSPLTCSISSVMLTMVTVGLGVNDTNGCQLAFLQCAVGASFFINGNTVSSGVFMNNMQVYPLFCLSGMWINSANVTITAFSCVPPATTPSGITPTAAGTTAAAAGTTATVAGTTMAVAATTASPCDNCPLAATLNPRSDSLTAFIMGFNSNGCMTATVTCVPTANNRYFVQYADTTVENGPAAGIGPPPLVCNSAGAWIDPTNQNRTVVSIFCYQSVDANDCQNCTNAGTSPPVSISDINVPLYNRSASTDFCCATSGSFGIVPTQNLTQILIAPNSTGIPGVIGTATCPLTGTPVLCFCGQIVLYDINLCFSGVVGGSIYLLEYTNTTTGLTGVYAVPLSGMFTGLTTSMMNLTVPPLNVLDTQWPMVYPILGSVACVASSLLCSALG